MSIENPNMTDQEELAEYIMLLWGVDEDYIKNELNEENTITSIKFVENGNTRLFRIDEKIYDDYYRENAYDSIYFIQITLSNDSQEFDTEYERLYSEIIKSIEDNKLNSKED